jgi:hypothetical protein
VRHPRVAAPTYRVRAADRGARIACRVTAAHTAGASAATSLAVVVQARVRK